MTKTVPGNYPISMTPDELKEQLKSIIDPETGVNIVDLGLVYAINVSASDISINITMTSSSCPLQDFFSDTITRTLTQSCPQHRVRVNIVWEPPWHAGLISAAAKKQLGIP